MLCYVMLCYVMLCYVMLCYAMLYYVMLCYVMLCYVRLGYVRELFWKIKIHKKIQAISQETKSGHSQITKIHLTTLYNNQCGFWSIFQSKGIGQFLGFGFTVA